MFWDDLIMYIQHHINSFEELARSSEAFKVYGKSKGKS